MARDGKIERKDHMSLPLSKTTFVILGDDATKELLIAKLKGMNWTITGSIDAQCIQLGESATGQKYRSDDEKVLIGTTAHSDNTLLYIRLSEKEKKTLSDTEAGRTLVRRVFMFDYSPSGIFIPAVMKPILCELTTRQSDL
jgi:hypothetical protein